MLNLDVFQGYYQEFKKKYLDNFLTINNVFEPTYEDSKSIRLIFITHLMIDKLLLYNIERQAFFCNVLYGLIFLESQNHGITSSYKNDLKKIFAITDNEDISHVRNCLLDLDKFLSEKQVKSDISKQYNLDLHDLYKRVSALLSNPVTPVIEPITGAIIDDNFSLN